MAIRSKHYFFDKDIIVRKLTHAEREALAKHGASIRKEAKSSMKTKPIDVHAEPGNPPFRHNVTGALLWRHLYFSYNPQTSSVIVGPEKLSGKKGDAPHVMEYGDYQTTKPIGLNRKVFQRVERMGKLAKRRFWKEYRESRKQAGKNEFVEARPYMRPALAKEMHTARLHEVWANIVK